MPPLKEVEAANLFNELMLFLACVWQVALNCFNVPFVVTDALARVIFFFEMEHRRLRLQTSREQKKIKKEKGKTGKPKKYQKCKTNMVKKKV